MNTEFTLTARAINMKIIRCDLVQSKTLALKYPLGPTAIAHAMNRGIMKFSHDGLRIVDNKGHLIAHVLSNEEDASATEYRDFCPGGECFTPIETITDSELDGDISNLRGLIDGQEDEMGSILKRHLGILLAEQARRQH